MKSPITGEEMKLSKERRSMDFRKETFEIVYHYYKCEKTGEQFTTTSLDEGTDSIFRFQMKSSEFVKSTDCQQ